MGRFMLTTDRRGFLGAVAAAACLPTAAESPSPTDGTVLRIAHCADPQFGHSQPRDAKNRRTEEGYRKDLEKCEREIEALNAIDLDLVYFAGDMVHDLHDMERDWPRLLRKLRHRWTVAPGNHDMGNRLTAENVTRFVSVFGKEYESISLKGWRIVVANSQYWKPTDEVQMAARHREWFGGEIASAKAAGEKIVIATHIPPYLSLPTEPESFNSSPREGRLEKMSGYIRAGARFWLCGHTHTMLQRAWKSLHILNAETTSNSFDARPPGFRLLEIQTDGSFSWEFKEV